MVPSPCCPAVAQLCKIKSCLRQDGDAMAGGEGEKGHGKGEKA